MAWVWWWIDYVILESSKLFKTSSCIDQTVECKSHQIVRLQHVCSLTKKNNHSNTRQKFTQSNNLTQTRPRKLVLEKILEPEPILVKPVRVRVDLFGLQQQQQLPNKSRFCGMWTILPL